MDEVLLKKFKNGREKIIIRQADIYKKNKKFYDDNKWKVLTDKEFSTKYEEEE